MLTLLLALTTAEARAPKGATELRVDDVTPAGDQHLVFLTDLDKTHVVPLQVGESEAIAVAFGLSDRVPPRPLTHMLFAGLATQLDARLQSVHIHTVVDGVYHARVTYRAKRRRIHLDARASDALALAVQAGAPIFMDDAVYADSGVPLAELKRVYETYGPGAPDLL